MKKIIIMASMVAALVGCRAEQPAPEVTICRDNVKAYFVNNKIVWQQEAINPGRVNMAFKVGDLGLPVTTVCHFSGGKFAGFSTSEGEGVRFILQQERAR